MRSHLEWRHRPYQHFGEGETTGRNDGLNDAQFAASRDSIHWMRYDRRPYIGRGLRGTSTAAPSTPRPLTCAAATASCRCTPAAPGRTAAFRALSDEERRDRGYGIGLVEQRLDGFVSADAAYTGGTLTTPPLRFSGERLELNIDVAAMGEAQVEVQNQAGQPLPGFKLSRCRRVMVNDVRHTMSWDGSPSLGSHAGRPIRLHFSMRSAKLHAFRFR